MKASLCPHRGCTLCPQVQPQDVTPGYSPCAWEVSLGHILPPWDMCPQDALCAPTVCPGGDTHPCLQPMSLLPALGCTIGCVLFPPAAPQVMLCTPNSVLLSEYSLVCTGGGHEVQTGRGQDAETPQGFVLVPFAEATTRASLSVTAWPLKATKEGHQRPLKKATAMLALIIAEC